MKPTLEEYKYDCAIIHVGINDIVWNKNDTNLNNLADSILEIANTCQNWQHWQNIHLGFTTIKANQSQYLTNQ